MQGEPGSGSRAQVVGCGSGPPGLQQWELGAPQAGFVYNSASRLCLNVAGCQTNVIFDDCSLAPKITCKGLKGQPNEEFAQNGSRLTSALPGAKCLTVDGTGEVGLATCDPANPPTQSWTLADGQLKTGDGRCMTATTAPTPPPAPPAPESCRIALARQLGTVPCVRGTTFDCSTNGTMWAAAGCAGLFNCNGVDNIDCDSRHTGQPPTNMSCACGTGPAPPPPPAPSPPRGNRTGIAMPGMQQINAIGFELEMFVCVSERRS